MKDLKELYEQLAHLEDEKNNIAESLSDFGDLIDRFMSQIGKMLRQQKGE